MEQYITVNQLQKKLDNMANADFKSALGKIGALVERKAKENAPVGKGDLRRSIHFNITGNDSVEIGTNLEYAPYVEYGTGLFAAQGNGRTDVPWRYQDAEGEWHTTNGMEPQPYLIPALEDNIDKIDEIILKALQEALR